MITKTILAGIGLSLVHAAAFAAPQKHDYVLSGTVVGTYVGPGLVDNGGPYMDWLPEVVRNVNMVSKSTMSLWSGVDYEADPTRYLVKKTVVDGTQITRIYGYTSLYSPVLPMLPSFSLGSPDAPLNLPTEFVTQGYGSIEKTLAQDGSSTFSITSRFDRFHGDNAWHEFKVTFKSQSGVLFTDFGALPLADVSETTGVFTGWYSTFYTEGYKTDVVLNVSSIAAVPEPQSIALVLAGMGMLLRVRRSGGRSFTN